VPILETNRSATRPHPGGPLAGRPLDCEAGNGLSATGGQPDPGRPLR
jgi:hypothetical protein